MALNRFVPQKHLDEVIKALDERIEDDRQITLRISDKGYHLDCADSRRFVMVRPAIMDNHLAFEFGDGSTSWTQNVIAVWPGDNPDLGAHCIDKWFAVDEGFLFNVQTNGEIPAHSISRIDGKQVRGPIKV